MRSRGAHFTKFPGAMLVATPGLDVVDRAQDVITEHAVTIPKLKVGNLVLFLVYTDLSDHDDRRGASKASFLHGITYHAAFDAVTTETALTTIFSFCLKKSPPL